jgi:peptidoglycan/LPS O-acetylase OafA/YrhL
MRWKPVQLLGLASYSIYLLHLGAGHALSALFGELPGPAGVALRVLVGTVAGIACWWCVEEPVARWHHRRRAGRRPAAADAPVPAGRASG